MMKWRGSWDRLLRHAAEGRGDKFWTAEKNIPLGSSNLKKLKMYGLVPIYTGKMDKEGSSAVFVLIGGGGVGVEQNLVSKLTIVVGLDVAA